MDGSLTLGNKRDLMPLGPLVINVAIGKSYQAMSDILLSALQTLLNLTLTKISLKGRFYYLFYYTHKATYTEIYSIKW